ncbi:MAG: IS200/IS605 family transposase [Deltaproteobacteria bacterium]|nr:IS200/IS605 family transposase [Deltaproteobacteria bacterium]
MPYWRLHYHLIWTTFGRTPWLDNHLRPIVFRSVCARAKRLGVMVHQIGGIEDHVHVVASVPPKLAVAECVGQLKGASSHTANEWLGAASTFRWDTGYGALSFGERSLASVIAYVRHQREHHTGNSVIGLYEQTHTKAGPASV